VLELARKAGMPLEGRAVTEQEVLTADELWLTSATKEVLAITTLNEETVGSGVPGPVFQRISALFSEFRAQLSAGTSADA